MQAKPKIRGRREVARSRLFRVEELDLEFANGNRRTLERVAGGEDSVLIVPLLDADTVLLVREFAAGSERYELGLPKGRVERGEDVLEAANRELQEEAGYAAHDLRMIHRLSLVPGYIQHRTRVVLGRDLYPRRLQGDEPEPIEVVPWRLAELDRLLEQPDFDEARSIAALFLAIRYLAREASRRDD